MKNILKKNNWLKILQNISKIINIKNTREKNILEDFTMDDISYVEDRP